MQSFGLGIIARSMSVATTGTGSKPFMFGRQWQYHPRSDRHSKIASWALMFDLMLASPLLRSHVASGKVAVGINHEMRDFAQNRAKNLDLVVCRAGGAGAGGTFAELVDRYRIVLDPVEKRALDALPTAPLAIPQTVLLAVEAKACMTEYGKARPRLYDELNSSHLTIHGDTNSAIAAGFVLLNAASTFVSPLRNGWPPGALPDVVSQHRQPEEMRSVAAKVAELPRRSQPGQDGFDALAIAVIECANDGSPVVAVPHSAGRDFPAIFDYSQTVGRIAHIYATRFSAL
jgi:hypothetical protein